MPKPHKQQKERQAELWESHGLTHNVDRQNINFSKHWHQVIKTMHLKKNKWLLRKKKHHFFSITNRNLNGINKNATKTAALHYAIKPYLVNTANSQLRKALCLFWIGCHHLKIGRYHAQCHHQLKDSANSCARSTVWRTRSISKLSAKSTHLITIDPDFTLLPQFQKFDDPWAQSYPRSYTVFHSS